MARPLSLQARSLAAASFVLAAFLGLAFFALDRAFYDAAESSLRDRLQQYIYSYLAAADATRGGSLLPPEIGPDPRFDRPVQSGLYAGILGEKIIGAKSNQWRSPSAVDRDLPFNTPLPRGEVRFAGPVRTAEGDLFVMAQGVDWNSSGGAAKDALHLTFYVAEDVSGLREQVDVYRRTLAIWLGATGVVLLLLLVIVLRWSLAPLRKVDADLARVERGSQDHLASTYPTELSGLTTSLNTFIDAERDRLMRYRNTLSDLAHSLKTPLAVMRSQLESGGEGENLRWTVLEQVGPHGRDRRVSAVARGDLGPPDVRRTAADRAVRRGDRAQPRKGLREQGRAVRVRDRARRALPRRSGRSARAARQPLENGFKWASRRVLLSANVVPGGSGRRSGMELAVEDDGPGIDEDNVDHLLQRGVRGDERVQGHGIGLAIVQDILRAYQGELSVKRSETLGGARFAIRFRPR